MIKRNNFSYRVQADITISKTALEQIKAVALKHYDSKCQQFAHKVDYWLWPFEDKPEKTERTLTVTWDEMDTVAKILECERYVPGVNLFEAWTRIFRGIRDESERVNAHHMMNNEESYSDSYRDRLKLQYGDGRVMIPEQPGNP